MKVKIEIQCDNDAFVPEPGLEIAIILGSLASHVATHPTPGPDDGKYLYDSKGNKVGTYNVFPV